MKEMEIVWLGATPAEEKAAQIGDPHYESQAKAQCKALIGQYERMFPELPNAGITLEVRGSNHEFGTYYEVCAVAAVDDEVGLAMAYKLEASLPAEWDDQAREALALATALN